MAAGGIMVVGIPFYKTMGMHWMLTILGAISLLLVPDPICSINIDHGLGVRVSMLLVGRRGRKPNDNRVNGRMNISEVRRCLLMLWL